MGLEITIRASYMGSAEECREKLNAFLEKEPSVVPGKSVSVATFGETVRASFFFAEEDVYFTFKDGNGLTVSAKTNGAGPGYHAYLTGLFERLRESCGLSWGDDAVEDDTGYWHSRDFEELRESMASWLTSLADALVENHMAGTVSGLAICMGTEHVPESDEHYAAHLLGWRERDFFRAIPQRGATEEDCEAFFIWWDEQTTPSFFLKCALCMMWCDCNWLSPVTDREKSLYTATFLCLESAWDDDPSLPFPVREWKEMAALSDSREIMEELERRFPGETAPGEKIGYLRGMVRINLGSGWRVTMPGAMHEELDGDDDTVQVFWDAIHTVRVSRFTVTGDGISAASLLDTVTEDVAEATEFFLENQEGVLARVAHEPQRDDGGTEYFGSFFFAAVDAGRILYISVFYDDEKDRPWAEAIFASCSWQNE
ncbi:hypothetical protein KL86DPRO_10113 [uncultured delta proteobacterium]|uniref:Uncharacterized protein n=1 Tax=uncultured delta proteobacterium TaxID=34034 RepID=A0A212IUS5_9DELT|nr:hypothetical protein KL86DPRO_10113 [uncultured delta proteobacterium]